MRHVELPGNVRKSEKKYLETITEYMRDCRNDILFLDFDVILETLERDETTLDADDKKDEN